MARSVDHVATRSLLVEPAGPPCARFRLRGGAGVHVVTVLAAGWLAGACSSGAPRPARDGGAAPALGFFATPGTTPPRYPARLAVAADGTVYVSDPVANRVFGSKGGAPVVELDGLDGPLGLAVDGSRLYVGNRGRRSVEIYDLERRVPLRALGQGEGEVEMPNSIAVAADGLVYVADSRSDVVKVYGRDGQLVQRLGTTGTGAGELRFPVAVAVDATRVVVGDQANHRVQVFDRAGTWLRTVGEEAPMHAATLDDYRGRFTRVQGVALQGESIYVLDAVHAHVQMFDGAGVSLGFIGERGDCPGCLRLPFDLAFDRDGSLLVSEPERRRWSSVPQAPR